MNQNSIKNRVCVLFFTSALFFLNLSAHAGAVEYNYYSDGSCKPAEGSQCLTKEKMAALCAKTKAWYQNVMSSVGVVDNLVTTLEQNMGKKAFQNTEVYVSKNNSCILKFDLVGAYNGNSYNRTYYCPVFTIEDDGLKKPSSLAVKSIDVVRCSNN